MELTSSISIRQCHMHAARLTSSDVFSGVFWTLDHQYQLCVFTKVPILLRHQRYVGSLSFKSCFHPSIHPADSRSDWMCSWYSVPLWLHIRSQTHTSPANKLRALVYARPQDHNSSSPVNSRRRPTISHINPLRSNFATWHKHVDAQRVFAFT